MTVIDFRECREEAPAIGKEGGRRVKGEEFSKAEVKGTEEVKLSYRGKRNEKGEEMNERSGLKRL